MDIKARIKELEFKIKKYNKAYRTGDALIPDSEYDPMIEELESLDPDNELLHEVGYKPDNSDGRMQKLPIIMASMNKIKTISEYHHWLTTKKIPGDTLMVCTPKFDGASFCVNELTEDSWTRGDGVEGQYSRDHYKMAMHRSNDKSQHSFYSYGEIIMPVKTFLDNNFKKEDGVPYSNPRNLVAGKLNDKKASELLSHCYYIRYGLSSSKITLNKIEQLEFLNTLNATPVHFKAIKASEITEKYLQDLFREWKGEFEIDGIIIEVNDYNFRKQLGRETGSKRNPVYARAFKGEGFEDQADTTVLDINYEVSKQGFLKPTVAIKPVLLNGALVSNPTGNNYKFIVENNIGKGAVVRVIRSGMVIPKIIKVISPGKVELPTHCPICKSSVEWNETKVEIVCSNDECEGQILKKIIAFFEIIGVDNMGEGVCEQLYEAGFDTIEKILKMSKEDMKELDRFGERKSEIVYNNIKKAITDIPLSKIQHASGCFKSLGSKKLELLTWANENTTISEIIAVDGFSEVLAKNYLIGIKKFNSFISNLPISIVQSSNKIVASNDKFAGWNVVFTGVRDKDVEKMILEGNGEIGSGVSKKTTHLVMKEKGSGSSKEKKAEELGVKIFELEEFKELL